jgi:hypothetical protein
MERVPSVFRFCFLAAALSACAADRQPVVMIEKPVTITVAVAEPVRKAPHILLQLEQVTTPKNASATWNMFIELPSADSQTPVEVPNFAGYITTLPNPSAPSNPPKGMSLQLPDEAARLVRKLTAVRLTFVPMAKFAGDGVRIGVVRLEPIQQ